MLRLTKVFIEKSNAKWGPLTGHLSFDFMLDLSDDVAHDGRGGEK
jgi:hypothetical protein